MILNPLPLHLANLVSSDGLFLALSMTWFALLLWIMYKPSNKIIGWHAIVLFAAFTVRYNALIYPFLAALAFGLSKLSLRKKITGWGLGILLCGWFVGLSMFQYKNLTGYWQFSPFSGWLLANNAMIIYREVGSLDREPVPAKFQALDNSIRTFYDSNKDLFVGDVSTAYMWTHTFPLMQYSDSLFKATNPPASKFKKWASMGPFYRSYASYIIKKYPLHFIRYYIWPNSLKYFCPPVEYLENYNWGYPNVLEPAVHWFGYKNNQVKTNMKSSKVWTLQFYPNLISITTLIMLSALLSYLLLKGWQYNPSFNKGILFACFSWIVNSGFSIFASSAALRFQAFSLLLSITFSLLLIDWMAQLLRQMKPQSQQKKLNNEYSQKADIV